MKPSLKHLLVTIVTSAALIANPIIAGAASAHSRGDHEALRSRHEHSLRHYRHRHKTKPHACGGAESADASTTPISIAGLPALPTQDAGAANGTLPAAPDAKANSAPVYRTENHRDRWYIEQVKSYTCGPSAMAMAIADHSLHAPPTIALVNELTRQTGTDPCDGMPDWWVAMPPVLQKHGLHTKVYVYNVGDTTAMDALDAELLQGHSAIIHVNNPRTHSGNGHFIYVAGKTADGRYVIGNPDAPANWMLNHNQPVTRKQLEDMMMKPPHSHPRYYKGVPGFVAVW